VRPQRLRLDASTSRANNGFSMSSVSRSADARRPDGQRNRDQARPGRCAPSAASPRYSAPAPPSCARLTPAPPPSDSWATPPSAAPPATQRRPFTPSRTCPKRAPTPRVADARPAHPAPLTFAAGPGSPSAVIRFGRREGPADIIWRSSTAALPAPGPARNLPHLGEPSHDVSALRQGMRQPHGRPPG
jgi:hypothetical protein